MSTPVESPLSAPSVIPGTPPPLWRRVLAAILDFLTAFLGFGFLIAELTGNRTAGGFHLEGIPALCLFALLVLYFVVGRRLGGPLWRRWLRAR